MVVITHNRVGTEGAIAEVEIDAFNTVTTMNSLVGRVNNGTFCNGTIVVTIESFVATDVDVADNRIGIARPYGQIQYVHFLQILLYAYSWLEDRVFVDSAALVPTASPFGTIATADRFYC